MPERDQLLSLLRRVRRRQRLQRGLQGVVWGTGVTLAATSGALWLGRLVPGTWATVPGWLRAVFALLLAAPLLFGLVGASRTVSLAACARTLDEAVQRRSGAGELRNGDRTSVAYALLARDLPPMGLAAVADAVRALSGLQARDAAPLRAPRGLGWVASIAAVTGLLALWPTPSPASRSVSAGPARSRQDDPSVVVSSAQLAAARDAAREARRRATDLGDDDLAGMAAALSRLVEQLGGAGMGEREAHDALASLGARAGHAAADGAALRSGLERAGAALAESSPLTKAVGDALRALDGATAQKALEDLASKMSAAGPAERRSVADALAQAAAAAAPRNASSTGDPSEGAEDRAEERKEEGKEERRRLAQNEPDQANQDGRAAQGERGGAGTPDRQLKRLERDLQDEADRCREDPAACAESLNRGAQTAPQQTQEAQKSLARQRLAEAVEQIRQRLRDGAGDESTPARESGFEEAARGRDRGGGTTTGAEGEANEGGARGQESAGSGREVPGPDKASSGADRVGRGPGGDPLGAPSAIGGRGHEVEGRVASGEGPSRAEVIEAGAREGFARHGYERVYRDYEAAVEEMLDATAVPAGRRQIVKRYFELIRPR